jgi:hypothetical protein
MDLDAFDKLLEQSRLPEATIPLCLRGDLQAQWEELDHRLTALYSDASRKLAGASAEEAELARRIQELEQEMRDSTLTLRLRALERPEWLELVADHPPREDDKGDRMLGFNQKTFFDALVLACLVEPELDEERLSKLMDKLTDAQFQKLTEAAWGLNRRDVDVPFSSTASHIMTTSAGTSRRQSGSGSASNGSRGGSRKKSSSTSTTKKGG